MSFFVYENLFEFLKERNRTGRLGRRMAMNRFGGFQCTMKEQRPYWTVHRFERSMLALEMNMMNSRAFRERITMRPGREENLDEDGGPTRRGRIALEDRSLRSCCQNAVVIDVRTK